MSNYIYRIATPDDLERIWAKNIADNAGDNRWIEWRDGFIKGNHIGDRKSFVTVYCGEPIGEGTLLFLPECIQGRTDLSNGSTIANVNALRMDKNHEGKGHMSRLIKLMEQYAKDLGYKQLTIGVEPNETRNLGIYLHWGYDKFIRSDIEEDDGALVLYYAKIL